MLTICAICGSTFKTDRRKVKSCSASCRLALAWRGTKRVEFEANKRLRFETLIAKSDGCWIWQGTVMSNGYGRFGRGSYPHRYAWELFSGQTIPAKMQVNHHCDTPLCVRPDHLYLGTQLENMRDRLARGRYANKQVRGAGLGERRQVQPARAQR